MTAGEATTSVPSATRITAWLLALLPVTLLFSGMAATPVLILVAILAVAAQPEPWTARWSRLHAEARFALIMAVLLFAWPLLSPLWSITPLVSLEAATRAIALMVFGAVAYVFCRDQHSHAASLAPRLTAALLIAGALLVAEKLLPLSPIRLAYDALGLDYAGFMNKSVNRGLAALAVLTWPAVAALQARGQTVFASMLPLLMAVPIFLMDSLSAKVALAAAIVVYHVLAHARWTVTALAVALPAFVAFWPAIFQTLDQPVFARAEVYDALPDTAQHRIEIWRFTLERAAERPWLGWGAEAARAVPGGNVIYAGERKYMPLHPHNGAMQILLEQGIVGLMLSCAALALLLDRWRALAVSRAAQAAGGAAIIAYLAVGFSAFGYWASWWMALGWLSVILWRGAVISPASSPSATRP
ncbi:MAG: O-antigen ligase family protein [Rhodospirillaceae bacterium]|nr:O-antigen ligase family protein [Rhodospirillaceae bacterium]